MAKSEVYSWRVSSQMKRALEEAARRQKQSISSLLETIVAQSLRNGGQGWNEEEAARQERLHAAAMATVGKLKSRQRDRSQRVRELVRQKLRQRHGRGRTH